MRRALLGIGCLLAGGLSAQRFYFENLGVQDGLPASKVYAVLQDSSGMIWLGTEAGLAAYDGITVQAFSTAQGMAPNGARSLFLDSKRRLWSGHLGGGITVRDGQRFRALNISGDPLTADITGITEDAEGTIWITTFGQGVLRVADLGTDSVISAERLGSEQGFSERVAGVVKLRDGSLAFIEGSGVVNRWQPATGKADVLVLKGLPDAAVITTLFEDRKGAMWLGTREHGAYHIKDPNSTAIAYDIQNGMPSNFIFCFGEEEHGNIWAGTWDGGIARIEANGIRRFTPGNGLHSNSIRCIVRDREGNMLIGTSDNGFDVFKGERFVIFTETEGLVDPQVWAVMEDRQHRIWFGTNGGISLLDPSLAGTGRVKNITMQQGELNSNRVRCLVEDARGVIWIGTENAGLFEFDPRTFRSGFNPEVSVADNKVTALAAGQPGELWVGSINGLMRYSPGNIPTVYTETEGLASNNITALMRDSKGTLWVGCTTRGVSRIDNGIARRVDLGQAFTATCFTEDKQGRIWVGTEGQGLLLVQDDQVIATYDVSDGLISNSIRSLMVDDQGHVWVGTNMGLNKWRPKVQGFLSFTQRSGFTGIEAKPGAVLRTEAGDLWFGTANGAVRVSEDKGSDKSVAPLISIRGLKVNLEDRDMEAGISLSHNESNVRITYGSVALSDPAAVRYQFMLEGLDTDWQPITNDNVASYPVLPPASYTFKVRAADRAGVWSEPAAFAFTIQPPWYRSWWFYTAMVLFIAIVLFSYIKVRERNLRLSNQALERKVLERTAEVVAQSEEIAGQKVQIEDLLLNILPKEISDELKEKGKATARRHEEVTVVFTDMKGFTRIAEKMTPEQLVNDLDDCFIRFDGIIDRYGIEKIKTIGDSYMCAGGVPTRDPFHAHKAVLAALEIRDLMIEMAEEQRASGREPWILRIGVHTGPVVAGVVGKRKFAYDIWGDAVNTASRMESSGEPGQVNISGSTYAIVKDHFECEYRGKVQAKNKGEIDMYFVTRIKSAYSEANGMVPNSKFREMIGIAEFETA